MGNTGFENVSKTRGKVAVADQLAQKLAQFDLGSLWEALGDHDRATLFAVAAGMVEEQAVG